MTSVRGDGSERPGTDDQQATDGPTAATGTAADPPTDPTDPTDSAGRAGRVGDAGAAAVGSAGPPAQPPVEQQNDPPVTPPERHTPWWKETLILVLTALVLALVIKTFFVQAFYIPSGSMENTLKINDRILVEKVSYWFGTPQRGDIIVFKDPDNWLGDEGGEQPSNPITKALAFVGLYPTGGHLVKRVIGVAGDNVSCTNNNVVVNPAGPAGPVILHEQSYVTLAPTGCVGTWSETVPPGHLWVLGDNRLNSADSRAHIGDPGGGFLPVSDVVGKVFVTVWPIDHWRFFHRPATFSNPALNAAAAIGEGTMPLGAFLVLTPMLYRRFGSGADHPDTMSLYADDEVQVRQ